MNAQAFLCVLCALGESSFKTGSRPARAEIDQAIPVAEALPRLPDLLSKTSP